MKLLYRDEFQRKKKNIARSWLETILTTCFWFRPQTVVRTRTRLHFLTVLASISTRRKMSRFLNAIKNLVGFEAIQAAHKKALEQNLRKYGLRRDDLLCPLVSRVCDRTRALCAARNLDPLVAFGALFSLVCIAGSPPACAWSLSS